MLFRSTGNSPYVYPISVTASDGITTENGYRLIVEKVVNNLNLKTVKVDSIPGVASGDSKYTVSLSSSKLPSKADFELVAADSASSIKLESMTAKPSTGNEPMEYEYAQIGEIKQGGGKWNAVDMDETKDFCKYRVSVIGADGATTKEYVLTVRVDSDNTELEYIKVGKYYASRTADHSKWEVRVPDTTEFANIVIKAMDDKAGISDFSQIGYVAGIRSIMLTGLNLSAHDKQLKFNVASQSGKVITEYKLVIIGDQSALDVKEITVNGNKAEAPADQIGRASCRERV